MNPASKQASSEWGLLYSPAGYMGIMHPFDDFSVWLTRQLRMDGITMKLIYI